MRPMCFVLGWFRAHRSPQLRNAAVGLALGASSSACLDAEPVSGTGQFGRPIALASDPAAPMPRLARTNSRSACPGEPGGCTSFCSGSPADCPEDACTHVLIDSGSPFTVLPAAGYGIGRECAEYRSAHGLDQDPPAREDLENAITRFRFDRVPVLRAPGDHVGAWDWTVGDELASSSLGGIVGGNLMRDFAVALRHQEGFAPSVQFFVDFPGSEAILANQGRAYIRLQFPGQLVGRQINDDCEVGGIDCEIAGIDLNAGNKDLIYSSTRMVVDACVAPSPCGLNWTQADESNTRGSCSLGPGGALKDGGCGDDLGASASMLVATGMPGIAFFDDSARAMFGDLASLLRCDALPEDPAESVKIRACIESSDATLTLAGWPPLTGLTRLRVRSLGLTQGLTNVSGDAPCARLRQRLEGLKSQCAGFTDENQGDGRPWRPAPKEGRQRSDTAAIIIGEVQWEDEQSGPDTGRWLPTILIPAVSDPALAMRGDTGSDVIELRGLIGSAMLRESEVVLDYTESNDRPGVRITCLDPDSGDCLSMPTCGIQDTSNRNDGDYGAVSCCFGLPPALLKSEILAGMGKNAPRIEDTCCPALSFADRKALHEMDLGDTEGTPACAGQFVP